MDTKEAETDATSEARLIQLIAALRVEPTEEANFEERFVADLRDRIAREAVCCPARTLLWEHCKHFFANLGVRRWVYGAASTCGLGALLVAGIMIHQPEGAPQALATVKAPLAGSKNVTVALPSLSAPAYPDRFTCISVSGEKVAPFTQNHRAISGNVRFFETEAIIIAEPVNEAEKFPVNTEFVAGFEPAVFSVQVLPVQN
ncbi:MAG: hypothetical protein Q4F35_05985 [Akkermansia sp.]|nr:hypothetical protein [Akkermansia sp.]